VVKAPKFSHITPIHTAISALVQESITRLTNALNIKYKLRSLTYKVLTTSQPDLIYNLISVQSSGRTGTSSVVTLTRPSVHVSSSLQITNRSFRFASPHMWNQLPSSFRPPHLVHSSWFTSSCAHHLITVITSLSQSLTPLALNSRLKTNIFHKFFLRSLSGFFRLLTRSILDFDRTRWALVFVCFSFFFIFLFLVKCARLSLPHSAFQSTLNSSIV